MFQSQDVARAIYFTPWYRFPYQLKRSLNIITMRSQKPAQLTAGHIIPLSLQTFASVRTSVTCETYFILSNHFASDKMCFRWCHPRHPFSPWYAVWIDNFIDTEQRYVSIIFMHLSKSVRLLTFTIVVTLTLQCDMWIEYKKITVYIIYMLINLSI